MDQETDREVAREMELDGSLPDFPPEVAQLVERMRRGDVRALARAVSLVEDGAPLANQILSCCFPHTGSAMRIGMTGSPGTGKSTLIDRLARHYRMNSSPVGVIAVDPTSPYSGGAILGDRIRMQKEDAGAGFYMRSMATRGSLGGLARTTADVAEVIEASGKERILIETVGAGQDEIEIVRLADVTIVVLVPGLGDDMQSIKAGMMEIADIFVVNRNDCEGADHVEREIRAMQALAPQHGRSIPPIVRTIGTSGAGVEELVQAIDEFWLWLNCEDRLSARREAQWRERVTQMIRHRLLLEFGRQVGGRQVGDGSLNGLIREVVIKRQDPYRLVARLVERLLQGSFPVHQC